ncbi:hypothetical protein ACFFIS_15255 [Virgibacillus soli]|uniref:DUF4878 domain-containing protein n=1 Tax=Paracerasibacillus soli TaxID=480284 RepID=A0ABU5CV16_9BACI|nr:hypothetical protein [Virgibacillus soli]MDY0410222.1 hypothetical protein [Virgibacillus soli]
MKKLLYPILTAILLISLTGCFGGGAASTVKDTYNAALNQDRDYLNKVLSQGEGYDPDDLDEIIDVLTDDVKAAKSIKNLEAKEYKQGSLNKEAVEHFNDMFDNNWALVTTKSNRDDYIQVWILQEINGDYFIVDTSGYDMEEFQEEFLK